MRFAPILPIDYLGTGKNTRYHMALAHIVLEEPDYADYYLERSRDGDFVILDNGVMETGKSMDPDRLVEAARAIEATEVVAPDMLHNASKTLWLTRGALCNTEFRMMLDHGTKLMCVPQGATWPEWLMCLEQMLEIPECTCIGIGKYAAQTPEFTAAYGRLPFVRAVDKKNSEMQIHLLGSVWGQHELSYIETAMPGRARGADSCLPFVAAQHGVKFSKWAPFYRPKNWKFDPYADLELKYEDVLEHNIKWMTSMAFWPMQCGRAV